MKDYMVKETVNHFHKISIDDELEIEDIIEKASNIQQLFDKGCDSIEEVLKRYKDNFGFEYRISLNSCGTETVDMEAIDII